MSRASKAQRQQVIADLLQAEAITSQDQIVDHLAEQGVTATQATVSRDLEDLSAIKIRMPGGASAYAIPDHPHEQVVPAGHLRRIFSEWVVGVDSSGNMVVLRTLVGSAHVVASAIDRSGLDEVLGTVAGDDTLFVVAAQGFTGEAVAELFRSYADLG
ncbi:MAG: transcriptional regulator of arginine metabolism [Acidimicrobiales bacterium]|jgi:transcriptional regulator of arginine metabolism